MTFKDFSKNLSGEIENLFATLGNNNLPEESRRLDQSVNFDELMQRIKNVKVDEESPSKSKT